MKYFLILILLSSCATLESSYKYSFVIQNPNKLDFEILNRKGKSIFHSTKTDTICLRSGKLFRRDKYYLLWYDKDKLINSDTIKFKVERVYYRNFYGLVGLIIDPITGAMWEPEYLEQTENLINCKCIKKYQEKGVCN